jgi:multiple sugar transport system substrate-binding protein
MTEIERLINRRRFLSTTAGLIAGAGLVAASGCANSREPTASSSSAPAAGTSGAAGGGSAAASSAGATTASAGASNADFTAAKIDWKQFAGKTITISAETHPWYSAIEPLLPQFTALTGINVTPAVLGEDQYVAKIAVQLAGGSTTPDVFMVNQFGQATGSGWLEPLDGYLSNTKLTDPAWYAPADFFPGALSFAKSDGKTMAMPITAELQMLFLRSDLIKKPPTTMDELVATAAEANNGSVAGFGSRAVANASQTPWPYGGFAFTQGGFFIDKEGKAALNSEANVSALKIYAQLLSKSGPKGVSSWGFLENQQAMQQGRLAMWTDSSTFLGDLRDTKKSKVGANIDAYAFPSQNGKSIPNVWFWTVGVNAKSTQKEAAWLFLQWATSKPISAAAGLVGASPARASAWEAPAAAAKIGAANSQRILSALKGADSTPMALAWQNTKWSQVSDGLARAVNSSITGADPATALATAQAQAVKILG